MNTKPVNELRSIAKDKGFCGYVKLKKAELIALLLEQWTEEIPGLPARNVANRTFSSVRTSVPGLHDSAKKTLKGDVESKSEKENQEEEIDLTLHEHERPLKGAFKSFVILMHLKQILIVTLIKPNHTSRP